MCIRNSNNIPKEIMGSRNTTFNKSVLQSALRQSKARMSLHRGKKSNEIHKKERDIINYIESGNENMALICSETLINDERMILCYDILSMMCDQMLERIPLLIKMGKEMPSDMFSTMRTMVYSAERANIDELSIVRKEIQRVYGVKFAKDAEIDLASINETVRENINLVMPEEGRKVEKIMDIVKKQGVMYQPCLLYTSPSPRDLSTSRMPSSA
eukprot:TRINITY_DN1298_c0_g1_i1.p1 TRINITY_DN1298_c0_g1~~TRINITY_DN1298_c0_g1_i1.p1  ORF type:complete len:223 (+),score=60.62 TRINITY_DN1298_c0_g1_i1:30-671(+)